MKKDNKILEKIDQSNKAFVVVSRFFYITVFILLVVQIAVLIAVIALLARISLPLITWFVPGAILLFVALSEMLVMGKILFGKFPKEEKD